MGVLYGNFHAGTITNNPLTSDGTTLNSAELADLFAVTGSDFCYLVLDPRSLQGTPEIVMVTGHTASSTSATISRAQQGSIARAHPTGTEWVLGVTKSDLESFLLRTGDTMTGGLTIQSGNFAVSAGTATFGSNVTVSGNLTVNGSTVTVTATTLHVTDPVITVGGTENPPNDDGKDRGIEFRWHDGSNPKRGFFGWDRSTQKFTFIPDATNTSEVFSGTKGTLDANLEWADILTKPTPTITVTLTGAVTGSGNTNWTNLGGNPTVSFATSIANDAITLGTHTTGNYVATIAGTTNQVNVSGSGSENAAVTLSLPQSIHTGATPTFSRLTLSQTTGTAPLTVSSTTMVANLNAEMVGGQTLSNLDGRYVLTAGGGTVTSGALSFGNRLGQHVSLYSTTDGLGVQGTSGAVLYARTPDLFAIYKGGVHDDNLLAPGAGGIELLRISESTIQYKEQKVWHEGNDGAASGLDADLLDGQHGTHYLDWTNATNKPSPTVTVTLTGAVTGSQGTVWTDLSGNPTVTVNTSVSADAIVLGTNTTGAYVATITGTANRVTVSGSGGENAGVTLSGPQDIHADATPTFARLTLSQTTGTAPLTVASTTVVTNLNADLLDGQHASDFAGSGHDHNSTYLALAGGSMTGNITFTDEGEGVVLHSGAMVYKRTGGTLTLRRPTGDANPQVESNDGGFRWDIWHAGNDGHGSGLDADLLDGQEGEWYSPRAVVDSLMGDLLYVGPYNPSRWDPENPADVRNLPNPVYWTPPVTNLLRNSSFEWDTDSDGVADHWNAYVTGTPTSASRTIQTSGPDTGLSYARVVATLDSGGEGYGIQQTIGSTGTQSVYPGQAYTFSAAVKGTFPSNTRMVLSFAWFDSNGDPIATDTANESPTGSWLRLRATRTAPSGAHYVTVAIYAEYVADAGGAATLDIDSVMFEPSSTMAEQYEPHRSESYRHGMNWIVSYSRNRVVGVIGKELDTDEATLTTAAPHGFVANQVVQVVGVDETFDGTWTLTAVTSDTFTYEVVSANVGFEAVDPPGNASATFPSIEVGFIEADDTGRLPPSDGQVLLSNGDWIVANNPNFGTDPVDKPLLITEVVFTFLPLSSEMLVQGAIAEHAQSLDPHSSAGYVTQAITDALYAAIEHDHDEDIDARLDTHRSIRAYEVIEYERTDDVVTITTDGDHGIRAGMVVILADVHEDYDGSWVVTEVPTPDTFLFDMVGADDGPGSVTGTATVNPHPQYLLPANLEPYSLIGHSHADEYEPVGGGAAAVVVHEERLDPHEQYLTQARGDDRYPLIAHDHDSMYYTKDEIADIVAQSPPEVIASDGASSARIFIGFEDPISVAEDGDYWISGPDISLTAPGMASNFVCNPTSPTTVAVSWNAWPSNLAVTNVSVFRNQTGSAPWGSAIHSDTNAVTSFVDTGRVQNATYYYRIVATNSIGAGTERVSSAVVMPNAAPPALTGVTGSVLGTTSLRLSWTASSEPDLPGSPYQIFKNGSHITTISGTQYDFTGLTENETVVMGVRAIDTGGLTSPLSTQTRTTNNANPPNVTGIDGSTSGNTFTATWNAVTGISDLSHYEVILKRGSTTVTTATTTATFGFFSGLLYSTSYTIEVRAVDTGGLKSASAATVTRTTGAAPDTTPPPLPVINSWQPVSVYGRLQASITVSGDTTQAEVQVVVWGGGTGHGTWTKTKNWTSGTYNFNINTEFGINGVAGNSLTIYVRARDAAGNWTSWRNRAYTLIASPTVITADATNNWRFSNGGQWNATNDFRLYQGYFSNPTLNYWSLIYYGTKPQSQLSGKTITSATLTLGRVGGGSNVPTSVRIYTHSYQGSPGTVLDPNAPALTDGPHTWGTLVYSEFKTASIPLSWAQALVAGTRRGIGIYYNDAAAYMILHSVGENGFQGLLTFNHLG